MGGAGGNEDQVTDAIAAEIERSLDEGKISWQRVIQLARWESLSPEEDPKAREVGRRFYLRAVETFQEQHGGAEVAIFPAIAGGAYLLGNGQLQMATRSALVRFNWSEAWRLVFQIDALAEEAKEWWQNPSPALGDDETALLARINQSIGVPAGYINPYLYSIDRTSGFRDIVLGGNGVYAARQGWDACTGWGTPRGSELSALLGVDHV